MPWKTPDLMTLRKEFVQLALLEGSNVSELCRRFGISRDCGHRWIKRYQKEGESGLLDRSKAPLTSPGKTASEIEAIVVSVRVENPTWGGRKIFQYLRNKKLCKKPPAASTITRILRSHDLLDDDRLGAKSSDGPTWNRFERSAPNDLWQMDFKGDFALSRGGRCHPLTALDDFSRFNIILTPCDNERTETVADCLERAFSSYGLPDTILCDNGSPWGCASRWQDNDAAGYTTLEVWLLARGVGVIHGRPYHPQTQGKEERFHRTLKADVISRKMIWHDLADCQERFAPWRDKYNHERPHESLDGQVPASRYSMSNRRYKGAVDEREFYREGEITRVVRTKGEVHFEGHTFYIGTAFRGKLVALLDAGDGQTDVYFGAFRIGRIDWTNGIEGKPRRHYERIKSVRREEVKR